jgi:hypothetical protein
MARNPLDRKLLRTKARQAALADTARRHPETYRAFYIDRTNEIFAAAGLTVRQNKRLPVHVDKGDGTCAECGKSVPCRPMRRRGNGTNTDQ